MRYMSSIAASVQEKKPRDFAAATESLSLSLDQLHTAYTEFLASSGKVVEVEGFMHDCHTAIESLKNHGITSKNMAIINKDNLLDATLKMDKLALSAVESLSDSAKEMLKNKYISGLEALNGENEKSFFQKIKDFIAKVWDWLKMFFSSDAKVAAMLKECKFEGEVDNDKTIVGLSVADADKYLAALKKLSEKIYQKVNYTPGDATVNPGATIDMRELLRGLDPDFKLEELPGKQNTSIGELGWTMTAAADKAKELKEEVNKRAKFKEELDKDIRTLRTVSENKGDGLLTQGELFFKLVHKRIQLLHKYKMLYNAVAFTVIAVDKSAKK